MKVMIAHIPYEDRGGEDIHVEMLAEAYRQNGIEVVLYPENRKPARHSVAEAGASLLPGHIPEDFRKIFADSRPDFVHLHNAFPTLGPAFFEWIIANRVRMIMTVHNHRFFCTNGLAFRDGHVCKDCFRSTVGWRPILYNCNSDVAKSAYHAAAITRMGTGHLYAKAVRKFIAPSPYIRDELVRFGISAEQVTTILNPAREASGAPSKASETFDALYAGRLSKEKGIHELLAAVKAAPDIRFGIAGDGPERAKVEAAARSSPNLRYFGAVSPAEVLGLIGSARIGVSASLCNEIFGLFPIECFVAGKRCVVSSETSSRWLTEAPFFGVGGNPANTEDFVRAIRIAINAPAPSAESAAIFRGKISMERFCSELKEIVNEVTG